MCDATLYLSFKTINQWKYKLMSTMPVSILYYSVCILVSFFPFKEINRKKIMLAFNENIRLLNAFKNCVKLLDRCLQFRKNIQSLMLAKSKFVTKSLSVCIFKTCKLGFQIQIIIFYWKLLHGNYGNRKFVQGMTLCNFKKK